MLEKDVERYLVKRVAAAGGTAYKFSSPARRGVPDRIIVMPCGRVIFAEVKAPGKRPTTLQAREHERLRSLGQEVVVVDCREACDALLQ